MSEKKSNLISLHFQSSFQLQVNLKVFTTFLGLWCLCQQQGEYQLTAKVGHFSNQGPAKRRLVPIIADSCTLFFYACGEYMRS